MVESKLIRRMSVPAPVTRRLRPRLTRDALSADLANRPRQSDLWRLTVKSGDEDDVIDLGAPRKVRIGPSLGPAPPPRYGRVYRPNPRLYPGPPKQVPVKTKRKNTRGRKYCRPVPNSRLYRPAPPRPPPPPARPCTVWRAASPRPLETASRVALRLTNGVWAADLKRPSVHTILDVGKNTQAKKSRLPVLRTRKSPTCIAARRRSANQSKKLVITLPTAAGDGNRAARGADRYRPTSQHFRARELSSPGDSSPTGGRVIQLLSDDNMDATPRHSTSPEDCSEGNDSHSAPSEFLAEFLSAIMRRQYAEALKYCRLILQYEPRNATARGFYPLLQQKLAQQSPREACDKLATRVRHQRSARNSRSPDLAGASPSSGGNSGGSSPLPPGVSSHEVMEQEADSLSGSEGRPGSADSSAGEPGLGSVSSQSSLELDSSPSLSLSRRTDRSSASGTWDSSGSGARDDNGNPAPPAPRTCCDAENNQPAPPSPPHTARARPLTLTSEQSTESLRRLRAQFTCSIK